MDELQGVPLHRDVDFTIELHPGTSPISIAPHKIVPAELQELKVQLQELLDRCKGVTKLYVQLILNIANKD